MANVRYIGPHTEGVEVPAGIGSGANPNDTRFKEAIITEPQLFNLAKDPAETNNLAAREAKKVKELSALLQKIRGTGTR